jgi:hypothetical protein
VAARWAKDADAAPRPGQGAWILPQAICDGWTVAQAALPVRLAPLDDHEDLSAVLAPLLGSLFQDMERHAPAWQRTLRSQPVPTVGERVLPTGTDAGEDVRPMIESYHLAYRNLQEIWNLLLPPGALVQLKQLALLPPESFRFPDALWAHVVFDFGLGYRLRTISRDHLLRALTPLYLAWVASYALEVQGLSRASVEARLERLCQAFEAEKPYLVRRWRWPDRFNP